MWLVSGVDEEHRFRTWTEAVEFYRQLVGDWVDAHGGAEQARRRLDDLPTGSSDDTVFPDRDEGGMVTFSMSWEAPQIGLGHDTAC